MTDKNLIETIDNQVEKLTKSIREGDPLHMRDARVQPDDGYDNYVTIAEAQVIDAMQYEKKAAVATLNTLKRTLLDEEI
jgi:hypothetical protein